MTKRKSKSTKSTVKAAAAKRSVTKSSAVPGTAATPPLIVLGFDEQQKPRGARFVDAKPDLVTKAADLLGFKVYEASSEDVAEYAEKLPLGRLYANGRGFVPNIRQSLYSDLVVIRAEWDSMMDPNGDGLYPGDPDAAQDRIRQAHGAEWSRWELTCHEIEIPAAK
ncbi:MAG: hypothetical protein WAV78_51400 [Xanthobacteraceae bacterium]|jgi:hypothetical protein